jgi:LmbE family N-acetylglucosaminyl deacetylase
MNILAIGCHPDDIELGCGGTLIRHAQRGDRVTMLVLTTGQATKQGIGLRRGEQEAAAAAIGADLRWGGFEDASVPEGRPLIEAMDRVIADTNPDILYVHAPDDSHQDHRNASLAGVAAARRIGSVMLYETPSTQHFQPTLFVDIDAVVEQKLAALQCHLSQVVRQDGPFDLEAIAAQARFRGFQAHLRTAEGFESTRFTWDLGASDRQKGLSEWERLAAM